MNYRTLLLSTCVLALGGGAMAHAQSPDVQELVVTANRSPIRIDQVGASVTVVDLQTIRNTQTVVVTDLLAQTPGVTFSRNGGVGKSTSLYIRGADSDQTVVLIDGVKLNDPSATGGGFSSGNLLAGDIARIELLRGAQSTLWGSQAIGGVINMITREPVRSFETDANVEAGSFNTAYGKASVGGRTDRVLWRLGAGYYTSDGVSAYARGTEDDGYRNLGANGRARVTLTDTLSVEARGIYSKGHNQFDATNADTDISGDTEEFVGYAGINLDLFDQRLRNRVAFAYTDTDRINWENRFVNFDAAGQNRRLEYQGVFNLADGYVLTFGAESERSKMHSASPTVVTPNPTPLRGKVGINSLYGQIVAEMAPGLSLTGGLRYDDHSVFGGNTVGQAALAYSINDGDTVFRASYGEGFKAPSLYQQFSEFGNAALEPEEAKSWDIGFEHHVLSSLLVSATLFKRKTDNLIDFVSCTAANRAGNPLCAAPRTAFYNNVSQATAMGVELGATLDLGAFTASANYTYLNARDDTPGANRGKRLMRRPHEVANASVSYQWPFGLSTGAAVRYTSKTFNNAANTQVLKPYTLVDVRASYPVGDRIEVYGRIENLFSQTYQTTLGYGTLGRGAYAGVRARL